MLACSSIPLAEQVSTSIPLVEDFLSILQKCRKDKNFLLAKSVHMSLCSSGLDVHAALANFIVPIFVDCGSMHCAQRAFNKLLYRKEHSWTSLIQGYVDSGDLKYAFSLSQEMEEESVLPGSHTFVALLKACTRMRSIEKGEDLRAALASYGLDKDLFVGNTLIDMYAKCGAIDKANRVFNELPIKDSVTWNVLLSGYAEHGFAIEALECYDRMKLRGIAPTTVTYVCSLKACSETLNVNKGKELHNEIICIGFETNYFVGNALVGMYAKCLAIVDAVNVFDGLQLKDVISWTALIVGFVNCGVFEEAVSSFELMQLHGVLPEIISWNALISSYSDQGHKDMACKLYNQSQEQGILPDSVTWLSVLKACADKADFKTVKVLHAQVVGAIDVKDIMLFNTLIDAYSKCGSMMKAQEVFDSMCTKVSETWTVLITGYAKLGLTEAAFKLFDRMTRANAQPNEITFLGLLSACRHAGLMQEGQRYFNTMITEYTISPSLKHYCCMVDLLSCTGRINEAMLVVDNMGFQPDLIFWTSILNGCCMWGNVNIGRQVFDHLVGLDRKFSPSYAMMSKIYMDAHMPEEAKMIEAMKVAAQVSNDMGDEQFEINTAVTVMSANDAVA